MRGNATGIRTGAGAVLGSSMRSGEERAATRGGNNFLSVKEVAQ